VTTKQPQHAEAKTSVTCTTPRGVHVPPLTLCILSKPTMPTTSVHAHNDTKLQSAIATHSDTQPTNHKLQTNDDHFQATDQCRKQGRKSKQQATLEYASTTNDNGRTTKDERQWTNDKGRPTNDERTKEERPTTNDQRPTTNDQRPTTDERPTNEQRTTNERTNERRCDPNLRSSQNHNDSDRQ